MIYQFDSTTDMRILPLSNVDIYINDGVDNHSILLENFREGSAMNIIPETDTDDEEAEIIEFIRIESTIYLLQNNFEDMLPALSLMTKYKPYRVDFTLESIPEQPHGGKMEIFVLDPIKLTQWYAKYKIENNAGYPMMTIEIKGIFSKDIIDMSTNKLFKEYF